MRPSIIVDKWGIKTNSLLGYAVTTDDFYVAREFSYTRAGTTPGTLIDASGNLVDAVLNTPRIDYTGGSPSLLVEPAATNQIRNNSMVGASAPNTLPNNWSNSGSSLTRQSVATGTLNGIPYVDVRILGTANNTFHDVFWDSGNIIAALVGQNWVASCYLQIIDQPNPPVNYSLAMREFNSSGGFLNVFIGSALSVSTTSFNRFSFTRALNQATVAFVNPSLFFALVNGQYYDFTIRIGYPQMELGSVATSVIPTTTASLTRDADVCTFSNASSLIGQTEGTLYAEVDVKSSSAGSFISIDVGSGADFILISKFSNFTIVVQLRRASGSVANIITSSAVSIGVHKIALSYTNGNYALYIDGVSAGTSTNSTHYPASTLTRCGLSNTSYGILNDRIRAVKIFKQRLNESDLVNLTRF